jgi:predicted GIY-YIG superfamily endonuclease
MTRKLRNVKGTLLKGVLENVPAESFEVVTEAMKKMLHGKSGIYTLYNDDRVYYIGLAKNLRGRIRWHRKDKHAGKWNKFSVFIIEKVKYLKDIETLILHISQPKGNKTQGRIPEHDELRKVLDREIRAREQELQRLKKARS